MPVIIRENVYKFYQDQLFMEIYGQEICPNENIAHLKNTKAYIKWQTEKQLHHR